MKDLYEQTDKYITALKRKIKTEFNYMSVKGFDELTALSTKQDTSEMFDRLKSFNNKEYLKIIDKAIEYTKEQLPSDVDIDNIEISSEALLATLLKAYNPVTGYQYNNEADRKRMRLNEEILTAKELLDWQRYQKALKTGANLWFTQSGQYGIDVADSTALELMKQAGVDKVQWITERDTKVCKKCQARDGEVYPIGEAPPKAHYHCRCYYVAYVSDNKKSYFKKN